MTIEQALQTAMALEKRIMALYEKAAAAGGPGKRIFTALMKEEASHLKYLNDRYQEWRETGAITAAPLTPTIPLDITQKLQDLPLGAKGTADEITLLEQALALEEETSSFYRDMHQSMSGAAKDMFARFAEIEDGHRRIVQAEIDGLSDTGFWFDIREFRLG